MDVGLSEINRLENYWTDSSVIFSSKTVSVIRRRFKAIGVLDPTGVVSIDLIPVELMSEIEKKSVFFF